MKFIFFVLSIFAHENFSQEFDSAKRINYFGGAATVTNNGISLLPTFTLGKPAVLFDMSVGGKKLSFEPQFRFSLQGKPWAFIFWWRYKLLKTDRLAINIGAHPSVIFRTVPIVVNGIPNETIVAQRFVAAEFSPNYFIVKNISIGMYYLFGHGLQVDGIQNTHFVTINSNFSNIKLGDPFFMKFNPQVYYLRMDDLDGYYFTSTLTFLKRKFPLSIQSIVNLVSRLTYWQKTILFGI